MPNIPLLSWIANAAACLAGRYGEVTAQARDAGCSRQAAYDHARKVADAVEAEHGSGPTRRWLLEQVEQLRCENDRLRAEVAQNVEFPRDRRDQFQVIAAAMGLSLNQIVALLSIVLGAAAPARSSVHRVVQQAARTAGRALEGLDRQCRSLVLVGCLDEIFFHGRPVLIGVEPASLTWFIGHRAADRTGATWAEHLRPWDRLEYLVTDAGSGLRRGIADVQDERRAAGQPAPESSLDVFHTVYEGNRALGRAWGQLERAWEAAEAADAADRRAGAQGKDRRATACRATRAWREVAAVFAAYERMDAAWATAREALQLFRPDGRLNDRAWAQARIEGALPSLTGREWAKVRNLLTHPDALTFLDRMHHQLEAAVPDAVFRGELVRLWWLRRQRPRGGTGGAVGCGHVAHLVQMVVCRGYREDWAVAYRLVSAVLRGTVRASSAVEGLNSVLRMHQGRHRTVTQEMLDLKRLYWNCRRFRDGARRGLCPYEHLGLKLGSYDFWDVLRGGGPTPHDPKTVKSGT